MRVLVLGPIRSNFKKYFQDQKDHIDFLETPIDIDSALVRKADFIISYGYRYILKKELLDLFPNRVINLHISYLPWNRGADPNVWSILEDTPKGVTIHNVDEGLDTGDILVQKEVSFRPEDTLRTSYNLLIEAIELLFFENWPLIKSNALSPQIQSSGGSVHFLKHRIRYEHLLLQGWDTSINLLKTQYQSHIAEGVNRYGE